MKLFPLLLLTTSFYAVSVLTIPMQSVGLHRSPSKAIPIGSKNTEVNSEIPNTTDDVEYPETPKFSDSSDVNDLDFDNLIFGDDRSEVIEKTVYTQPYASTEEMDYLRYFKGQLVTEDQRAQLDRLYNLYLTVLTTSALYPSEEQSTISHLLEHLQILKKSLVITVLSPKNDEPEQADIVAELVSMQEKQFKNLEETLKLWETGVNSKINGMGWYKKLSSTRKSIDKSHVTSRACSSLEVGESALEMSIIGLDICAAKINDLMEKFFS